MALIKVEKMQTINNIKVCQVENRIYADLLIYVTDLRGVSHKKEHLWTYVESEAEADLRIYWGKNSGTCLRICFVDNIASAGWLNKNHLLFRNVL